MYYLARSLVRYAIVGCLIAACVYGYRHVGNWHLPHIEQAVAAVPAQLSNWRHEASAPAAAPLGKHTEVEIGFSPGDAESLVVHAINSARRSVLVADYSFTSRPIARALVQAQQRGVKVTVVLDKSQRTTHYSRASFLAEHHIPVRINSRYEIMHDKFLVVDDRTIETGSFNYTYSAQHRNAENVLVLIDDPAAAATYTREWDMLWKQSQRYTPGY